MIIRSLVFSLIAISSVSAFAIDAEQEFALANQEYRLGNFSEAISGYQSLLERDGPRAAVLQNLGSAYFRIGDNPRSILAFERALFIEPRNPDLRANRSLARDRSALFPEPAPAGWRGIPHRFSSGEWARLAIVSAIGLPCLALIRVMKLRRGKWVLALVALLDLGTLGASLVILDQRKSEDARAIVIADSATVRISPFEQADAEGTISGGQGVWSDRQVNDYVWIRSQEGGRTGWVKRDEIERIDVPISYRK